MKLFTRSLLGAAALAAASLASAAGTANFNGALATTDPTFTRPNTGTPPTALNTGSFFYDVAPFFVTGAGSYTLQTLSATIPSAFGTDDTFIAVYQGSFNRLSPLTNAIGADDDGSPTGLLSLLSLPLATNTQYFLVITSYANGAIGPYTGSISNTGPGQAVFGLVPEPSTYLMLIAGLGLTGWMARRRMQG